MQIVAKVHFIASKISLKIFYPRLQKTLGARQVLDHFLAPRWIKHRVNMIKRLCFLFFFHGNRYCPD